jgi:hypothetical protein
MKLYGTPLSFITAVKSGKIGKSKKTNSVSSYKRRNYKRNKAVAKKRPKW